MTSCWWRLTHPARVTSSNRSGERFGVIGGSYRDRPSSVRGPRYGRVRVFGHYGHASPRRRPLPRRLTDTVDGFLAGHRVLICDRDGKWTDGFRALLEGAGVRIVLTPVQAPNANAYAERFVRSIREECLDHLILFGERRLLHVLKEFMAHYHGERNHQGLDNDLIAPMPRAVGGARIGCRDRLGGLLRYYYRAA